MAHFAKYKAAACGGMIAHYERRPTARGYVRDNIDAARTHRNYNLCQQDVLGRVQEAMRGHQEAAGRKLRSDAVVMADWVITLPQDCPVERTREFFEACLDFLKDRYGEKRVLGAYIHMDETTPHGHFPLLPQADDGRLAVKKVVNREDLRTFHQDLADHVCTAMGERYSILLSEEQEVEKALSGLSQKDYKAARAVMEVVDDLQDHLAEIDRREREMAYIRAQARQARAEAARADEAELANAELAEQMSALEKVIEQIRNLINRLFEYVEREFGQEGVQVMVEAYRDWDAQVKELGRGHENRGRRGGDER